VANRATKTAATNASATEAAKTPRKPDPTHGGYRPGAGRKKQGTAQGEAYALLAKAKTKREHYLAQMAELDYKKAAGELIPADEVARVWEAKIYTAKGRLLALPARLAPELLHLGELRAIETTIRDALLAVMDEMADDDPNAGD